MAKKLNLSATKRDSEYGDFTRGYRQSSNVEDRRVSEAGIAGKRALYGSAADEFRVNERSPTQTPFDPRSKRNTSTAGQGGDGSSQRTPSSDDPFTGGGGNTSNDAGPAGLFQARKVSPEEAIDTTFRRRN